MITCAALRRYRRIMYRDTGAERTLLPRHAGEAGESWASGLEVDLTPSPSLLREGSIIYNFGSERRVSPLALFSLGRKIQHGVF